MTISIWTSRRMRLESGKLLKKLKKLLDRSSSCRYPRKFVEAGKLAAKRSVISDS